MNETINERISRCRKLANLTQTEAAEKMGMKCSTYSQMERKGMISTDRLLILAKIFDVSVNYLLCGTVEEASEAPESVFTNERIAPTLRQKNDYFTPNRGSNFIATKKEENIIKILRNLPKPARDEIVKIIEEKYKENK